MYFLKKLIKKFLWRIGKPLSDLFFLSHSQFHNNPFGEKLYAKDIHSYEKNFKESVSLENHPILKNDSFLEFEPNKEFIFNLAFKLQNVIKKSRNSFIHGFILSSLLEKYLSNFKNENNSFNIVDIGTARGFSSLCMANVLEKLNISAKIFTFDLITNRKKFYWNGPSDFLEGHASRMELLKPWHYLVYKYIVFFSVATYHSLRVVDIPLINFAFIDGSHTFNDVYFEINYILKRLHKKSIVVFDDYDEDLFPGVVRACRHLMSLNRHSQFELIPIQNKRKLAIFYFGI